MLSLPELQQFKIVAEIQNLTKAAEILHLSQPALSRSIKKLQDDLGCPLFRTRGRGIELNTYGKIFLEYVTDALNLLSEAEQRLSSLITSDSGLVRISCLYSLGANLLPFIIKDFKKLYPNITLTLEQQPTRLQLDALRNNLVDVCFCTDSPSDFPNSELERMIVMVEDLYLLVNRSHRWANRNEVELKELDKENFIAFSDLTLFQKNLSVLFKKLGIQPNIVYSCNEDSTVAGFVAAGEGVAVIPPIMGVDFSKCKALKISYPVCQRTLSMVWSKTNSNASHAVQTFTNFVLKWLPDDKLFVSPYYELNTN